jgi:Na+-transporting methylmalonyl-CoA/oxaloacetate decarboxylase gamma subunit
MPDNLQQAIDLIKAGDKATARPLLVEIVKADSKNDTAWLWLSQTVARTEDKIRCLEKALDANPHNEIAQQGLERLRAVEAPALDDIAPPRPKKRERTQSQIRRLAQAKPVGATRAEDRQLLQGYIAMATRRGWQVVSQTETSVQLHKAKKMNTGALILGLILIILAGIGLLLVILALLDYAIQKEGTVYVTVDDIRAINEGTVKDPTYKPNYVPALVAITMAVGTLCICALMMSG